MNWANTGLNVKGEFQVKNANQKIKILACQIDIPVIHNVAARDRHLENTATKIVTELKKNQHDLVVLPELSSIEYSISAFDKLELLAESIKGPSFKCFSKIAMEYEVCIAYGIARKDENDCYISHVVIGPDGEILGHFDKLHIANFGFSSEKKYFRQGDHLFVFECKGIKIAPIICYDIRIPELSRTLALKHNVQLILHCGAYGRDQSFYSWHHFVVTRALENQLFILSLNRAGEAFGNSFFCPPWVDETQTGISFPDYQESMLTIEVSTDTIDQVKSEYSFLVDKFDDYDLLATNVGTQSD